MKTKNLIKVIEAEAAYIQQVGSTPVEYRIADMLTRLAGRLREEALEIKYKQSLDEFGDEQH